MALPARFADIKASIAASYPDFEANAIQSWGEILQELNEVAKVIKTDSVDYVPQVNFTDLHKLSPEGVEKIKRRGTVVIKDIVPDEQAAKWKDELKEFVKINPDVDGLPRDDKQFFSLFWTKPQVQARSHPNVLAATAWLNNLYSAKSKDDASALEGVDLNVPLSYADRFRIRKPGVAWELHPPHVDGGGIERWEDSDSLYGRPGQATVFRTFQGWLALSETAPTQGTLKVFPDVLLSNAYCILRPFFTPTVPIESDSIYDGKNWKFDISAPDFPGIIPRDGGFIGPRPKPELHPNLRLEENMTSVPKVHPGDAVFWHCDVIHAVEEEHTGGGDSAVIYIPAVPLTPTNQEYVERQAATFLKGKCPPDMPQGLGEAEFVGVARLEDIISEAGKRAMGLVDSVA
ncbi:DUF1479-domain-containing protein [Gymnopilus junonius]|uniref:DUF1479-domain-containing protein n=1 Tax=Gymnopilus junonius TaxID=109634 RepID=A0A9P5TIV9_GYMJU|nr:DUF1479-domain-containing protein [Gymnopilus junonius]